jgi:hypothetical protein
MDWTVTGECALQSLWQTAINSTSCARRESGSPSSTPASSRTSVVVRLSLTDDVFLRS